MGADDAAAATVDAIAANADAIRETNGMVLWSSINLKAWSWVLFLSFSLSILSPPFLPFSFFLFLH